jgi:biopolymer transport protein ExbD/biopolymer transport protein TolR
MKRGRGKTLNQEMNLTNLIDVIFSILIVFMISAPLMSQGIQVNLPDAEAPSMEPQKLIRLSIETSGKIFIEDHQVDLNNFSEVFQSMWDGQKPVVVNADEKVDYGLVMQLVSAAQKAGVKKIGFLTLPRPKDE